MRSSLVALFVMCLTFVLLQPAQQSSIAHSGDGSKPLRVHIIAGGEYDPVPSMTEFKKYLETHYRVECTTSYYSGTGSPSKLENLDSLKSADLLILRPPHDSARGADEVDSRPLGTGQTDRRHSHGLSRFSEGG